MERGSSSAVFIWCSFLVIAESPQKQKTRSFVSGAGPRYEPERCGALGHPGPSRVVITAGCGGGDGHNGRTIAHVVSSASGYPEA